MGQQFEFICPQCDYKAVVAGGFDCGMMSAYVTIVCRDCRELCDVLVDQRMGDDEVEEEADAPVLAGLSCPKGSGHDIELWEAAGPCPKCGTPMREGRPGPMWD